MKPPHLRNVVLTAGAFVAIALTVARVDTQAPVYDPLTLPTHADAPPVDLTVSDKERSRDIPIRVYLPTTTSAAPVVLFSPGLGGSRDGYVFLARGWALRGYVVVVLQHPGSDDAVWREAQPGERRAAMVRAASVQNFALRARDVSVVLDQLEKWNEGTAPMAKRLDLAHVGMSGHSFGAITTQAVSGQLFPASSLTDVRIDAALAMSPSRPLVGDAARAFADVKIPWLLMTGTNDVSPIGGIDAASRLAVFAALPPGNKYELVLAGAEHSIFSDGPLPGDRQPRNPKHQTAIRALSIAFWDACLRDDVAARAWLNGDGPRAFLAPDDRWQRK